MKTIKKHRVLGGRKGLEDPTVTTEAAKNLRDG